MAKEAGVIIKKAVYFEKPGRDNSKDCLDVVKEAVEDGRHKHLVIATTGGDTALLFGDALRRSGLNIVAVTHSAGFREPNEFEVPPDILEKIKSLGIKVFTGPMLTHSIETAFIQKFNGFSPMMVLAQALRRFGEGTKVACEIVMMAVDAGLVPEGQEVLAVAGTGRGADTVLLIKSAASKRFFDLKVLEVLAKARG